MSSVTSFGLFVELNDIYIEGLVHITELRNDYYHFDPVRHCLEGERSRTSYHLGDSVEVKVVRVNLDEKKIDLQTTGSVASARPALRRRKPGKKKGFPNRDRSKKHGDKGKDLNEGKGKGKGKGKKKSKPKNQSKGGKAGKSGGKHSGAKSAGEKQGSSKSNKAGSRNKRRRSGAPAANKQRR